MFLSQKEVNIFRPLSSINVDISQRLQTISLPITDCALDEATMNECKFCFFLFHLDLNDDGVEDDIQCSNPCGDRQWKG